MGFHEIRDLCSKALKDEVFINQKVHGCERSVGKVSHSCIANRPERHIGCVPETKQLFEFLYKYNYIDFF